MTTTSMKKKRAAADGASLGARLTLLRQSLDGEHLLEVPKAAMDRVAFSKASRHVWRSMERGATASNPPDMRKATDAVHGIVKHLDVPNEAATAKALIAFLRAEGEMPWTKEAPPKWKEGHSPMLHAGRPHGSRVFGATTVIPAGEAVPADGNPMVLSPRIMPPLPAPDENTAMLLLSQIKAGALEPVSAMPLLKLLLGNYEPQQDLTRRVGERHSSQEARQIRSLMRYSNPSLAAYGPLPLDLMTALMVTLPDLSPEAFGVLQDVLRRRADVAMTPTKRKRA